MQFLRADITESAFPVSLLYILDNGGWHRRTVTPDDDISDLRPPALKVIRDHWQKLGGESAWAATNNPPSPPPTDTEIEAIARAELRAEFLKEVEDKNLAQRIAIVRARLRARP